MSVTITEGTVDQREVVARLLELNAYEFSRIDGRSIGDDGRYGYPFLDLYWSEPERVPYLILVEGELAGFALVRRDGPVMSMAEFLVLPKFRRMGVGIRAARQIFGRFPGRWHVGQLAGNDSATEFWRRAIPVDYTENVTDDGAVVQSFTV